MNKEDKKILREKFKQEERMRFLNPLPFDKNIFLELFDFLDKYLEEHACDDTTRATEIFLEKKDLLTDVSLEWMRLHGGFCDCEVLSNLEERFEKLV